MSNMKEAVMKMDKAWGEKDETAFRALIHDDYTFQSPMSALKSADEAIALLKIFPFTANTKNHEFIIEDNKVVHVFDWEATAPFQKTIPMTEIVEFDGGKAKKVRLFYDTGLFPQDVMANRKS
jgi:hypothetical protein